MTQDVMEWLRQVRKLDADALGHMQVRAVDHQAIGHAAAFPYQRRGETYAAKFRTIDKKFRSSKDVTRGLYNEDCLNNLKDQPIVITEGEIDCISVMQAGFLRAVSVPDGWVEQGNKTDAIIAEINRLKQSPYVVVAADNDKAGESLPKAVANALKGHDVRYVTWPKGCKDANDVLVKGGEGDIVASINAAKRIDPPGGFITAISDLPPMSDRRVLRTGNDLIDGRMAFEMGAMSVGTGVPGAGKSTFMTWVADQVAKYEGIKIGLFSFETHPHRTRDHLSRLETGRIYDALTAGEKLSLLEGLDARFRMVHRIYEGDSNHNLAWLKDMIYTLAVRDGCKMIIIDPWNELEHMPEVGENMTNYINFALQQIRQWAETLEVHICVIAHPKKMDSGFGKMRAPLGYDIADSAAFANKPSLGFTIASEKTDLGTEYNKLITWKVRDTQLYNVFKGHSDMAFDVQKMSYSRFDMDAS